MKNFWLVALLVMFFVPLSSGHSQESSSDTNQLEQLELELIAKRKEATALLYGNFYQAEELNQDISMIVPTGNERITITERGILAGGDNSPGAYWLIKVENISEQFQPGYSVLNYLMIQEDTPGAIKPANIRITHLDSQLMYERPLAELDLTTRFAPGTIQYFRILVPLENPFSYYQLVHQLKDDTFTSEVYEDNTGSREIMIILEQPDINLNELDLSQQLEILLAEITELDEELIQAKTAYYSELEIDPSTLQAEDLDIPLYPLSQDSTESVVLVQHGIEQSDEIVLEAFWVFKTTNTSSSYQYATKGLWWLTAHQSLPGLSNYSIPYTVQQVEPTSEGYFYLQENNLEQAMVEPGWEGYFKVSMPLGNALYEHYLLYGAENSPDGLRLEVYNEGVFN